MWLLGLLSMDAAITGTLQLPITPEMVHEAIMRVVRRGRERELEVQIERLFQETARQPGECGAHPIRPGSHAREYRVLRSFASRADRDRF